MYIYKYICFSYITHIYIYIYICLHLYLAMPWLAIGSDTIICCHDSGMAILILAVLQVFAIHTVILILPTSKSSQYCKSSQHPDHHNYYKFNSIAMFAQSIIHFSSKVRCFQSIANFSSNLWRLPTTLQILDKMYGVCHKQF